MCFETISNNNISTFFLLSCHSCSCNVHLTFITLKNRFFFLTSTSLYSGNFSSVTTVTFLHDYTAKMYCTYSPCVENNFGIILYQSRYLALYTAISEVIDVILDSTRGRQTLALNVVSLSHSVAWKYSYKLLWPVWRPPSACMENVTSHAHRITII